MKTLLFSLALMTTATTFTAQAQVLKTSNYQNYALVQTKLTQVALAKIQPHKVVEFKSVVDALLPLMRAQKGNIRYEYSQSKEDPTEFVFHENWINGESIKNHMESQLVQDFFARVGTFFEAGYPQLIILKEQGRAE